MHHRKGTECCPSSTSDSGDICRKLDTLLLRKFIGSSYLFPNSKHSFASAMGYYGNSQDNFFFFFFLVRATPVVFYSQEKVIALAWHLKASWPFLCPNINSCYLRVTCYNLSQPYLVQLSPTVFLHLSDILEITLLIVIIAFLWVSITISLPVFLVSISCVDYHSDSLCLLSYGTSFFF